MSPYAGKTVLPRRFGTHPGLRREGPPPETRRRRPRQSREVGPSQWNTRPRRDVRLRSPAGETRVRVTLRHVAGAGELDLATKRIACLMAMPTGPRSPSARSTRITPGLRPGRRRRWTLRSSSGGCFRVENEFSSRPGRVEALRPFSSADRGSAGSPWRRTTLTPPQKVHYAGKGSGSPGLGDRSHMRLPPDHPPD